MDDTDAKDSKGGADPKGDDAYADMGADDINDPMWRERGDAEHDEERNHVFLVGTDLGSPLIKDSFPFRESEEGRAQGGRYQVTEGCS